MPTATTITLAKHRKNLDALRAATEQRIQILQRGYDELIEAGDDVGAGEDEGGSEADGSFVERDRLRAQIGEERAVLEALDAAVARTQNRTWQQCRECGGSIGAERLDALPTAELCVTCKARQSW
ncbi:MAG: TraR/DksA C4-type zinc finger protein [Acidimicrobiales bacterium]